MSHDIPKRQIEHYELNNIQNAVMFYIVESIGKS